MQPNFRSRQLKKNVNSLIRISLRLYLQKAQRITLTRFGKYRRKQYQKPEKKHQRSLNISVRTQCQTNQKKEEKEKIQIFKTRQQTKQAQGMYHNKEVKKGWKDDKKKYVEQLAKEAERACNKLKGDIKSLYNIAGQLSDKPSNDDTIVKDK